MRRAALLRLLTTTLALLLACRSAQAHAILVASTPAIAGTVPAGHVAVTLRFNSRIDRDRSRISLTWPDHGAPRRGDAVLTLGPTDAEEVLDSTIDLSPGRYVLHWQVLAVDGHITRGDVPFTVGTP